MMKDNRSAAQTSEGSRICLLPSAFVLLLALSGCTPAQRDALTPETVAIGVGGGLDRDSVKYPGVRTITLTVTPVWRIKPAPVAKVADLTTSAPAKVADRTASPATIH